MRFKNAEVNRTTRILFQRARHFFFEHLRLKRTRHKINNAQTSRGDQIFFVHAIG